MVWIHCKQPDCMPEQHLELDNGHKPNRQTQMCGDCLRYLCRWVGQDASPVVAVVAGVLQHSGDVVVAVDVAGVGFADVAADADDVADAAVAVAVGSGCPDHWPCPSIHSNWCVTMNFHGLRPK